MTMRSAIALLLLSFTACGESGTDGLPGERGPAGPAGEAGPQGATGPAGAQGPAGPQGNVGPVGPEGPAGPAGLMGQQGPQGPPGVNGIVGPRGFDGPVGPVGPQGPAGPAGPQGIQGIQGVQGPMGPGIVVGPRPANPAAGALAFDAATGDLDFYDGARWRTFTETLPSSCRQIKGSNPAAVDGPYTIRAGYGLPPTTVYCDMTTQGGGWTLVSYGYRAATGGTTVYLLPNAASPSWNPVVRNDIGAIDASQLLKQSRQVALTVAENMLVTGNLLAYTKAYVWTQPNASIASLDLFDPVMSVTGQVQACATVSVNELKANVTFNAQTIWNKPQVSCSGNKAGTPYERQLLGFNSEYCYGVCGSNPVTSNGMVVWYGSGYSPTTSGGLGTPERAGSFGFWVR